MAPDRTKELNKERGSKKASLTLFANYLKILEGCTTLSTLQITELEVRLTKIDDVMLKFDELQTEYESLCDENDPNMYKERELFETTYYSLVAKAKTLLSLEREARGGSEGSGGQSRQDFVRLPKISLPNFDGDFQHWLGFRDTYLSIIHNNKSINDINKFHYLRSALQGSAALIIQSLEFTASNYEVAWNLLSNRYDNERLLVNNHLNALFNLQSSQKESSESLRNIIDVTNKNLRALSSLGQPTDHWDTLIIYIMAKKLDTVSFREWEEHRGSITGYPTLQQFISFITNRADLLDTLKQEMSQKPNLPYKQTSSQSDTYKQKHNSSESNNNIVPTCPMCNKSHYLFSCQDFRNLDVQSRLQRLKNYNVCKNCLKPGHAEKSCKLSHCKYCNLRHNTLVHTDRETEPQIALTSSTEIQNIAKPGRVLLSTALVKVADSMGRLRTVRVLLDNASTTHYVTQHLCEKLGLVTKANGSTVVGINNQVSYSAESCDLTIQSHSNDYRFTVNCFVLPTVTEPSIPSTFVDITGLFPSGIQLADPTFNTPSTVDILLGAAVFWEIMNGNLINLGSQRPKLLDTKLGWLVHINPGHKSIKITEHTEHKTEQNTEQQNTCFFVQNTDSLVTRFWELESVSSNHCLSQEERACEQSFAENTRRDEEGRFVVTIPLKESPEVLGDSYAMAKRRFLSLERRLLRNPILKERYLNFMSEYLALGHMSESPKNTNNKVNVYIPQHAVIRESSTTTKVRAVADAAAPTDSGKSFNDIQMVGPVVQDDLFSILLRFRQHKYVVSGDVEKMYRAILIDPSQRHLQQILFRFTPTEQIRSYTLNTVTYGTASAPYLATKCLVSLADQCLDIDAKNAIRRDFYVDDFLSGGDSIPYVVELCKEVIKTLQSAKFNLRKWQSNSEQILASISQDSDTQKTEKTLDLDESLPNKTLGLYWNANSDQLLFSINISASNKKKITKRVILSLISQVFDPLGILGPCTVEAKMLMQKLWIDKCGWDVEVTADMKVSFTKYIESLAALKSLRIPRWVCGDAAVIVELHTFTDSSERAYGSCVYVRTVDENGKVCVRLLASKNKVAPLKPETIPRLELCGALLGTRLSTKVLNSLTKSINKCFYWTDSMIVLGWLNTSPSRLKTFIRNRVGEIQDSTSANSWRYVPSKENPADLVSRGVSANQLNESSLWWTGPSFLHQTHIDFPKSPVTHTNTPLPEITLITQTQQTEQNSILKLINKKSNYTRLVRTVAYIQRFINNCRNPTNKTVGILNLSELQTSENIVLRVAQQDMFPEEYESLKLGQPLHKKNRLISMSPFMDSNNIIRANGRLSNSNYTYDVKHPILLASKHHLTDIIFHKYHIQLQHAGPQMLLSQIRQKYWPLGGRNLARRTARNCVRCARFKSKSVQPVMAPLPQNRTHLEFPFLHTGIDYAGPVLIVDRKGRGSRLMKSYICIFVCFAVKALHLELVTDLTKECFLAALFRFTHRRGNPQTISSDNGTTFVGASNELNNFFSNYSDDIQTEMASHNIEFKFIPPYTPHFGGLWESAVKSVKHHLRRILSLTHLTYEEMSTCLIQIEGILNSRPLTPLSPDPSDLTCLTPTHFLIGRTITSVPQPRVTEININRLQRYERIEQMKQHFWQRFSHEYVTILQQKTKWQSSSDDLKLGAMVLVRDKNQPPLLWLLGRITKLHTGPDNVSRVADILTKKGVIQRAYNNICPLPITLSS